MSSRGSGYDVVILGGGPAGCVLASRLSEDPGRSVCLIEAGPDYGPYDDGRWPPDLLYANELATSHDWGLAGGWPSWRAKVIGGCSSHNGCFVAWGSPDDFIEWVEAGDPGWSYAELDPYRRRCEVTLRVRPSRLEDLEPFMRMGLDAAAETGIPVLDDFDDPNASEGAAPIKVNAVGDIRWNAAFAYLDPARERQNLTVMSDTLIDKLRFDGDRGTAAVVHAAGELEIESDLFVLAAGAYGTPAILLRSGIGPADDLARTSVAVRTDLPGVGQNLTDHPRVEVVYRPTDALLGRTEEHVATHPARAQTLIKARSKVSSSSAWDLHVMMRLRRPLSNDAGQALGDPLAHVYVHAMKPASRGSVRIATSDPDALPIVDHGFLTDGAGNDSRALRAGIALARRLATTDVMRGLLREEIAPGRTAGDEEMAAYMMTSVGGYWHPVGTCKMGPTGDSDAVVDATGRLRGSENVYVADASIMPTIPRANTNLLVVAIAERIARSLSNR